MKKFFYTLTFLVLFSISEIYPQTHVLQVKLSDKEIWAYANIKGEILFEADYPTCYPFSEDGIALISFPKQNLYSLINIKGEQIQVEVKDFYVKDVFGYSAQGFANGLLAVKQGENKKWGYVNVEGRLVIPLKYDYVSNFNGGFATARLDDKFYIINKNGNETLINDPDITEVKEITENLAPFRRKDKSMGFVDTKGAVVIKGQFYQVGYFRSGLAWVKSFNGFIGYINAKGEYVIKPRFSAAKDFDEISGLARVKINDKWCYVNRLDEIVTFNISEITNDFSEGLCKGRSGYFFGFYNNLGEWVIEPKFESVRDFQNGFAAAKLGGKWGLIDKTGNWVIEPIFIGIRDVVLVK